jgi:hypothetical protein
MAYSERRIGWKLLHCWWLLFACTCGLLNWLAFLYAGLRVKKPIWLLWSILYLLPVIVMMFFRNPDKSVGLLEILYTLTIPVSFVHALLICKKYLQLLDPLLPPTPPKLPKTQVPSTLAKKAQPVAPVETPAGSMITLIGNARAIRECNLYGFLSGGALLLLLLFIRLLFHPLLFAIGLVIIAVYFIWDYRRWQKNGIWRLDLTEKGLWIFQNHQPHPLWLPWENITGIDLFQKINRYILTILTGGSRDQVLPGVTLFSGSRLRVPNDAFSDQEYRQFVHALAKQYPRPMNGNAAKKFYHKMG